MPTYMYDCRACQQFFARMRSISERDHSATCPECHSADTQRRVVVPLTLLRGIAGRAGPPASAQTPAPTPTATFTNVTIGYIGDGVGNATAINAGPGEYIAEGLQIENMRQGIVNKGGHWTFKGEDNEIS